MGTDCHNQIAEKKTDLIKGKERHQQKYGNGLKRSVKNKGQYHQQKAVQYQFVEPAHSPLLKGDTKTERRFKNAIAEKNNKIVSAPSAKSFFEKTAQKKLQTVPL